MDALFQRPLGPTFSIVNFPKKILVKAEIKQFSFEKFLMKIEGKHAISVPFLLAEFAPSPRIF